MSEKPATRPAVVVIGGGYAGSNVAKQLDDIADVTLVEPRDAFVHNVAALRALADPSWLPRIYLPYDRLLATRPGGQGPGGQGRAGPGDPGLGRRARRRLHRAGHRLGLPVPGQDRRR